MRLGEPCHRQYTGAIDPPNIVHRVNHDMDNTQHRLLLLVLKGDNSLITIPRKVLVKVDSPTSDTSIPLCDVSSGNRTRPCE